MITWKARRAYKGVIYMIRGCKKSGSNQIQDALASSTCHPLSAICFHTPGQLCVIGNVSVLHDVVGYVGLRGFYAFIQ